MAEFCRDNGVSVAGFYSWSRRLREAGAGPAFVEAVTALLADGAVPIHNNAAGRMKRIALNRKNSLSGGNEPGGRTAAILSGFTSTWRRHGIDPQVYLTQLLTNLPGTPVCRLDQWLPDRWTPPAKDL